MMWVKASRWILRGAGPVILLANTACSFGLLGQSPSPYQDPTSPPTHPMPVFSSDHLDRPYRVIGIISAKGGSFKRWQSALYKLKVQAAEMGGHALLDFKEGGVWVQGVKEGPQSSPFHLYSAKVIVFESSIKEKAPRGIDSEDQIDPGR